MEPIRYNPIPSPPITPKDKQTKPLANNRFATQLQDLINQQEKLKVSKHATDRISQRNIDISDTQWQRVEAKVNEAKSKGIKDSLVLLKDAALIVSVKNQTVITAMDMKELNDHLFTNIDGTIIVQD